MRAEQEVRSKIPDPDFQKSIDSKLERNDVLRAIHELPEAQRKVVSLKARGFSYVEISHRLDIPRGTVMSRLYRGRENLRRLLNE